ncbi:MAG TPA: NnrU family protein [Steroidobacteraceae bacterium]|nr:NnrU family protein [Steroidobacteraceae bacterium]
MQELIAATAFFLVIHLGIAGTSARAAIVQRIGEKAFRAVFSLLSIAGLVWLVRAYSRAPFEPLWTSPPWMNYVATALAFVGVVLVVVGLLTPNPTTASFEPLLKRDNVVRGMLRVTRHPFLWGVALWALGHLAANGDLASVILFGSFLFLVLVGTVSIDAKRKRAFGEQWERFAGVTSNVPFGAIAAGRNQLVIGEIGLWRIGVALAVFVLTLYFHAALFGVEPLP